MELEGMMRENMSRQPASHGLMEFWSFNGQFCFDSTCLADEKGGEEEVKTMKERPA